MARGENASPIGGEIYTPSLDGTVLSAEGVKDYSKGMSQEMLNYLVDHHLDDLDTLIHTLQLELNNKQFEAQTLETDLLPVEDSDNFVRSGGIYTAIKQVRDVLDSGYLYKGIATPSTNPGIPSSNCFYIACEDGTYINFGSLVLEVGNLNILKYDGISWSVDVLEDVGSGDGAFDVSAKFPTSGVEGGNTYTLEGALAVLNANLSASKKKGGMSIKFIQSSDNKYVQYFLTNNVWSASESDWQGIDSEPVAGSRNVVESGGVQAKTQVYDSCLESVRTVNLFDKTKIVLGKYVNRINGQLRTPQILTLYFATDFIPIDSAGCYAPLSLLGGTYFGWACYSSASEDSFTHGGGTNRQATFQEGDAYVRFSGNQSELDTFMVVRGTSADVPSTYQPYGYLGRLKNNIVGTDSIVDGTVTKEKLDEHALEDVEGPINNDILIKDNTYLLNITGVELHSTNQYVRQVSIPSLDITKTYTWQFAKQSSLMTDVIIKESGASSNLVRTHLTKNGVTVLGDNLGFIWVNDIEGLINNNSNGRIDTLKVINCSANMNAKLSRAILQQNVDVGRELADVMWNLPDVLNVDADYSFWYNENTLVIDYDILYKNGHYFTIDTDGSSKRGEGYGYVRCNGTYITFNLYRANYNNTTTLISSHTITIATQTKLTNATKNVIFVGDSYTNSLWGKKGLIGYIQEFAEADGNTLVSKGTRDAYDGIKAEGYNGFSIDDFIKYVPTSQRPADWPNTPSPIKCSPFMFSDDDTVANAKFNFAKYLTDNNIGQVDCIVIFLGVNGGSYATMRSMIQGDTSFYVSSFRAALPNTKIIVVNLPAYYGFKTLSDVSKNNGNNDRILRNNNYIKFIAGVIENVVIAPTNEMDRIYGYRISDTLQAWTQFKNDTEVDNDVEIPKNYGPRDIHPSTSGIKSIAYSVYHCLFVGD